MIQHTEVAMARAGQQQIEVSVHGASVPADAL